jgi:Uma2 family endonuclease
MKTQRARKNDFHLNGVAQILCNGDQLTQTEFHRRYENSPPGVKAELIGGIVYMPSPTGSQHSDYHGELTLILGLYKAHTPGTKFGVEPTSVLGDDSEPEPDNTLRVLPEYGGQTKLDAKGYVIGAPEFIGEIAHSSVAIDLGRKKEDYERAGVQEYLVLCISEQELNWFHFPTGRKLKADAKGIFKSKVFPGLWIDQATFLAQDTLRCAEVIQMGVSTREHAEFVARLQRQRKKSK